MTTNWRVGLGFSLLTAVMWGALPIALKIVLGEMDTITVTWYRFAVSAMIALLWYGRHSVDAIRRLLSRPLWPLTTTAIFGLLLNYILYLTGLDNATAEAAQILIQVAPLLLLLGSVWLFKENFSALQWLGVMVFSAGMPLFFYHRILALGTVDKAYLLGLVLLFLAAVSWTFYSLAQKQLIKHVRANDLLLLLYIAGTVAFLPASSPTQALELDALGLIMLAFAGLNTIIAYGSFGMAMTHWESSRVSAVIALAPLFTLMFVSMSNRVSPGFVPAEPLDWLNWLGAMFVVGGSTLAALGNRIQR
jgi:drug/metabolite transporter (DMT)-like permease